MTDLTSNPSYRIQIVQGKTYEELGPLLLEELMLLVDKDMLHGNSLYFDEKEHTWKTIDKHPELFHKLFPLNSSQDEVYEVLFAKVDKPVLKEAKTLTTEELKAFYAQGVITPNSIVFDKEHKTWVPLRSYKKLFHALNPELEKASAGIALPAASKTLAGRFAEPSGLASTKASGPISEQASSASQESLPTAHLHAKNILPRIHERSAQKGISVVSNADKLKEASVLAIPEAVPLTKPEVSKVFDPTLSQAYTAPVTDLYTTLGQKPLGPSLKKAQGSILQQVLLFIGQYSKWLMGLSGICLSILVYQYHQKDCQGFFEGVSLESLLQFVLQYPFVPILAIYFLLSFQILAPLQNLARGLRLSIGFIGGAGLGYYAAYMREASWLLQGEVSLAFAVLGMLGMASPRSFSFGLVRVLSLVIGGYLGFIYKTLGYTSLWLALSLGVISLHLGLYPYTVYTGRLKHVVFLIFSTFVLAQLCILQFIF
jgi:hypothetical protein